MPVRKIQATARRPRVRLLRVCSWCDEVWLGRWVPRDRALRKLGVDHLSDAAPVTHVMCERCLEVELAKISAASLAA